MSILKSIINSIRAASSNEGFEKVKIREYHDKVIEGINQAMEDGEITAEEIADVKGLVEQLEITDSEMGHIKLNIMKNLISNILEDQKVTDEEMALFNEVEDGLNFAEGEKSELEAEIKKVKSLYNK